MEEPKQMKDTAMPNLSLNVQIEDTLRPDPAWDQLARTCSGGSVFLTSGWLCSWAETLGLDDDLVIGKAFAGDRLVGAVACTANNGVIEFAGKGPTDYCDVLISATLDQAEAQQVFDALIAALVKATPRFRAFDLGRIQAHSRTLDLLQNSLLHTEIESQVETPRMDMSAAPEALRKKSLRRHAKGLEKRGEVSCTTYTATTEILPRLDGLFDLHIKRWSQTDTPSAFLDDAQREFYRSLIRNMDGTDWIRFTELRLNDELVAAHFGFLLDGIFTWYKPCYDTTLSKLSPGEVLIKQLIELCVAEQADVFDFTIGAEKFKLRFATEVPFAMRAYVTDSWLRFQVRRLLRSARRAFRTAQDKQS